MNEYSNPTKFIDLSIQQDKIRKEIENAINRVLDHGQYIMGPEVKAFEKDLIDFTGAKHALTCANGTDALSIVLMAWNIGHGDAVFVPSFTYVASAEAPAQLGATPFFVDVSSDTFNLDPDSLKQAIIDAKKLGLNPKAVVVVDLFGQPAETEIISSIAHNNNMKVLVDAAQSFGSSSNGTNTGVFGDATTTSFFPAKPLGCYGDGGAIFVNDEKDAKIINSIRLHGKGSQKYDNVRIGLNSRLDTIQAAILIEKLKLFKDELVLRNKVANYYSSVLKDHLKTPEVREETTSAWAQYTIIYGERDNLKKKLESVGIPTVVYYPIPLSLQGGYAHFPKVSTGTPNSELLSKEVLSLPMHPYISKENQQYIIENIIKSL